MNTRRQSLHSGVSLEKFAALSDWQPRDRTTRRAWDTKARVRAFLDISTPSQICDLTAASCDKSSTKTQSISYSPLFVLLGFFPSSYPPSVYLFDALPTPSLSLCLSTIVVISTARAEKTFVQCRSIWEFVQNRYLLFSARERAVCFR